METTEQHEGKENERMGYRIFSAVRTVFVYALAILIVLAAVLFAADRSPDKSIFGYRYYIVLTESMSPVYHSGDMVIVKRCGAESVAEGDAITFNPSSSSDAYLTHRVTQKLENYEGTGVTCFRTKGDANDAEDSFLIDESRLIGKVTFHVPVLGTAVRFVQLRWYFIVPLVLLVIVFFWLMRRWFALRSSDDELRIEENRPAEVKT